MDVTSFSSQNNRHTTSDTTQNNAGNTTAQAQAQTHAHHQCTYRPTSFQVVRGLHKKHLDKLFLHDVNISPNREGPRPMSRQSHEYRELTVRVIIVVVIERETERHDKRMREKRKIVK